MFARCSVFGTLVLVFSLALLTSKVTNASPGIGECGSSVRCGPDACCLIGFQRYSFPSCTPRGNVGDWCRINGGPEEKTIAFPNGFMIHVPRAYSGFCPCLPGLVCSRQSSTCQLPEVPGDYESSANSILY